MSMRAVNQNNVLAGSFVIVGILLAVGMSFILGDIAGKFGEKKSYVVRFPTKVGVMGLEPGAEVTFAGLAVGTVTDVSVHYVKDEASGEHVPGAMDVVIELEAELVLFEDAIADLSPPILGGISRINIASAGTGEIKAGVVEKDDDEAGEDETSGDEAVEVVVIYAPDAGGVLDDGEMIAGRFAPSILTQMGLGADEAEKIRDVIHKFPKWSDTVTETTENAKEVSASARRMTAELEVDFGAGVKDGRATIENIRIFTDRLSAEGGWKDRVDSIMESAEEGVGKFNTVLGTADDVMNENRGKVGRILDNVENTTHEVRFEMIEKVNDLLADGALAVGSAKETIGEINGVVIENRPRVDSTMMNVQKMSLTGKLMIEELKAMPWRVFRKPTNKERQREPLFEAARSYAGAVADLKMASVSLDTAVRLAGGSGSDPQISSDELTIELKRLAAIIDQAYGRYEEAERGLLRVLAESQ